MKKRILVTGGTSGIGLALARRLTPTADLLLTGRRAAADIRDLLPEGAAYAAADQAHPEAATATIAAALAELGWDGLDLAVLNAGLGRVGDPAAEAPEALRETLDANLLGPILLSRLLLPRLEASRGKLVLIGSTAHRGAPGFASYAASKAGLNGFARALAEEWRGRVEVRVIHPGPTATGMHQRAGHDPGRAGRFFASPETMAALVEEAIAARRAATTISFVRFLLRRKPAPGARVGR
ncbi:SDR family NAD(P)-dependent oxidoreductase [Nitratireductor mangrovi]|uniref:SDR family NAD(P)-dependent oxidoreductase n=1 Tax=Nitratireductor mangrovi TaxID=2599600 RepID=A0A5B8KV02_9HYPH|nr:SDR family NAD(P)-dependent oxidoreductase [Nitratireductor mangrovi]QDY99444.1 SDR family NAD(P)-dependent oxidoreductase [Nitratireductor mangrovi]